LYQQLEIEQKVLEVGRAELEVGEGEEASDSALATTPMMTMTGITHVQHHRVDDRMNVSARADVRS